MEKGLVLVRFDIDSGRERFGLAVREVWKLFDYEMYPNYTKLLSTFFGTRSEINRLPCLESSGASPLGIWVVALSR